MKYLTTLALSAAAACFIAWVVLTTVVALEPLGRLLGGV
jgi:hypothetical protein